MNFNDIDILEFGKTVQITGMVLDSDHGTLIAIFPDEWEPHFPVHQLDMTLAEWEKFLYQSDVLETIVENPEKAVVRKSQRHIDTNVSWAVFRRDGYRCLYCRRSDVPLTVDHIILWEEGGPSAQDNLISSCRPCNRTRGRMPFADWVQKRGLTDPYILDILRKIPELEKLKVKKQRSR